MKCFYHSADLDGHCSGAIVKYFHVNCEMIGINYGDEFPWDSIWAEELVLMVDFSLPPEDMKRLNEACTLIWIDHHKTAIDALKDYAIGGRQKVGLGACALVWSFFHAGDLPLAVQLLAEYDVWELSRKDTLPFQYGLRFEKNTYPDNQDLWVPLFTGGASLLYIIERGEILLEYETRQNVKKCKSMAFESVLHTNGDTYPAICCNLGMVNSRLFESAYDPTRHDVMVAFCRRRHEWNVSLYSTKDHIDCGVIAKEFGGGGHVQAAGFSCQNLPFKW